jgi:divalent metal cation (Fe/Co/Zn/Cd) transporter
VRLASPAVAEIMDAAPDPRVTQGVREAAMTAEGVARLEKCHARKMGTAYYVDLHVEVDGALSVGEGHRIAHRVKDAVRGSDPRIADVLVHIEPSPGGSAPVDPPRAP